jgi:transcriptional regulator with XRE-family HTH domain
MKVSIDGRDYIPKPRSTLLGNSLGEIIKMHRLGLGMSLEKLAENAKTSKGYIWEIEENRSMPSFLICARICKVAGIDINRLANFIVKEDKP